MAEILVHSACLMSLSFASRATGYGRAMFQDVKGDYSGTNRFAAAHRALFALHLDGRNAADIAKVAVRPGLRSMVIAPQARTDLVMRPVNYADQLLENAVSGRVFELFHSTLIRQSQGKPVEKHLVLDSTHRLKSLLVAGFDEAADTFRRLQRQRGWQELRLGSGPAPFGGVTTLEIDKALDGMKIQVKGPTHYGDLPEIVLGLSQEITQKAQLQICQPDQLDRMIAGIQACAR
jgi:hypothetical protein